MLEMNEERIKKILGNRDPRLKEIHERILAIHDELADTDSLIESASMKTMEWDKEGGIKGGIKKDLVDVMLRHQKLAREREIDLRGELYQLAEEEETITRIWVCFRALRGREYRFLEQLYVKGIPYKAAEMESGVSHKTFERYRRRGLKKILDMYRSEFRNLEIVNRSNRLPDKQGKHRENAQKARKEEQEKEPKYIQLKLDL